ncbi:MULTISPECIES: hypothetical protein [Cupriavidus]|uniref:Uncharacterized protein n=1 Tax=Cupriavidus basilensis TaxID=68895 RepID=A0A643G0S8_9BURK|nr:MULTISPECIES: hypothetical protein [Cupriavidus]NOV23801.1 hypothetical protein [Cupriavidus necator]QOT81849.1 hypothetical protein F7R26_036400 [Cupriavidus basilensis]BDB30291.1 hypothetical protein CTP10_R77080 [Cupriavidus sp. P-10]
MNFSNLKKFSKTAVLAVVGALAIANFSVVVLERIEVAAVGSLPSMNSTTMIAGMDRTGPSEPPKRTGEHERNRVA